MTLVSWINITGNKIVRMAELKSLYESLGFTDVTTYIQSGNVIFDSGKKETDKIAGTIAAGIKKEFGFDVTVVSSRWCTPWP